MVRAPAVGFLANVSPGFPNAESGDGIIASPGFGFANPILSLLEDLIAIGLFALAILLPVLAALAVATIGALIVRRSRERSAPLPA